MPTGLGYLAKAGVVEQSAYGTPLAVTELLPIKPGFDGDSLFRLLADEVLEGKASQRVADQGVRETKGRLPVQLRYQSAYLLLKHFFGTFAANKFSLDNSIEGKFLTLAAEKQVSVWEFVGVKIPRLSIESSHEAVMLTADLVAKTLNETGTVNTSATLAALSNTSPNLLHSHLNFRIGDTVDALAAGDEVKISSFALELDRGMDEVHVNEDRTPIEGVEPQRRNVTLRFQLERYTTNQFRTWLAARTILQARLFFDDPASTKSFEILLPELLLETAPVPVADAGPMKSQITARCYRRVNNTIMTVADEAEINLTT